MATRSSSQLNQMGAMSEFRGKPGDQVSTGDGNTARHVGELGSEWLFKTAWCHKCHSIGIDSLKNVKTIVPICLGMEHSCRAPEYTVELDNE